MMINFLDFQLFIYFRQNLQCMRKLLLILFLFVFSAGITRAQVTLYSATEYRGLSLKVNEGSISRMSSTIIGNGVLSSIIIPSGFRVTMYQYENFQGYAETFSGSLLRLPNTLAGKVSSMVITKDNSNGWVGPGANNGQSGWNNQNVTIFTECYYGGSSNLMLPTNYATMPANFNRRLSSIRIPSGYEVDLYTQPNFTGRVVRLRTDQSCVPAEWNNVVASMKVYKNNSGYLPPDNYDPWSQNDIYNPANRNVTIYDKCNYSGQQLPLADGPYGFLPSGFQLKVYSIKVPAGKEVLLYSGPNFTGSYYRLTGDRSCMSNNFEFMIASIKIQTLNNNSNTPNGWIGGVPGRPTPVQVQQEIKVFNDCNYSGKNAEFKVGNYPFLVLQFNNNISSIRVPSGRRVILYTGINYTGSSYIVTSDNQCLTSFFNNRIRSMIVEGY
jgi:hypothetical protein